VPEIPVSAVTCPELSSAFILYGIHLMITSSYVYYASRYYNMDLPPRSGNPVRAFTSSVPFPECAVYTSDALRTHAQIHFFIIPVFVFLSCMFTVRDGQGRNVFGFIDCPVAIFVFTARIVVCFAIDPRVLAKVFPSSLPPRNRGIACEYHVLEYFRGVFFFFFTISARFNSV